MCTHNEHLFSFVLFMYFRCYLIFIVVYVREKKVILFAKIAIYFLSCLYVRATILFDKTLIYCLKKKYYRIL